MFKKIFNKITGKKEPENNDISVDQKQAAKRMMSGNFTIDDFISQLNMIDKLGSLQKYAKFVPGMGKVSPEMIAKGKAEAQKFKVIAEKMTDQERQRPHLITSMRKQEIALASGSSVQLVNQMLEKFEQSKQFVKLLKKNKSFSE